MGLHSLIIIICQYSTTHIFSNKLILVLAVPLFMHVAAHFFMTNIFKRFFLFFLFTVPVNHSFLLKSTVSPLFLSFCIFSFQSLSRVLLPTFCPTFRTQAPSFSHAKVLLCHHKA